MPGKISIASLILKIIFISVLFVLIGIVIIICYYTYDEFTAYVVRNFSSEDRLDQFRKTFLTPGKFLLFRIFLLILTTAFSALVYFIRRSIIIAVMQEVSADFIQVLKNIKYELKSLSFAERIIASCVLFFILGIRILYFAWFPVFVDEAFSYVHFVSKGFLTSAFYYPGPNNHIFYSELCAAMDLVFDDPILVMRIPSMLAGLVLVLLIFLIVKKYWGFTIAIITTIIFSLSEQINFYSIQGRGYILFALFVFLAAYSISRILFQRRRFYLMIFVVSSVLGFYTLSIFLYPYASMLLWSLLVSWKKRDRSLLIKIISVYSLVAVLVFSLYLPVLMFNPAAAIFGNTWVSSHGNFYSGFSAYVISLNDFWWGDRLGILFSAAAITGLIRLGLQYRWLGFPAVVLFLLFPLLIIFIQQVLPFERVWLYYLPVLCTGLSYLIMELTRSIVKQIKWRMISEYVIIFSALAICSFFSYSQIRSKTFSYYRESEDFYAGLDSMNIKNIEVQEPEYNTLMRFYALRENSPLKVRSGEQEGIHPDLLVISKDREIRESGYVLLYENSAVKAYKPLR